MRVPLAVLTAGVLALGCPASGDDGDRKDLPDATPADLAVDLGTDLAWDQASEPGEPADPGPSPDLAVDAPGDAFPADGGLPDGRCRSTQDCPAGGQYCFAPGDPSPCGICRHPDRTCGDDAACQPYGQVCDRWDVPCKCTEELACVPPCGEAGGRTCGTLQDCVAGHCTDRTCTTDGDCPAHFRCPAINQPHCVRKTCTADADCPPAGACVNGTCRDALGTCTWPVP